MKGVILDLGSDGSFPQFPVPGTVDGIFGPMEKEEAKRLMKEKGGHPVEDQEDEWTVGERDFLGRIICDVRFVFVPLYGPKDFIEKIRHLKS